MAAKFQLSVPVPVEPVLWQELVPVWEAFLMLRSQVSGDFSRAICGQDIELHLNTFGVHGDRHRRLYILGILGMQREFQAWKSEQQETNRADS